MKNKLKILHLSDTHNNFEAHFNYDLDVDVVCHTGDAQCYDMIQFQTFVEWFKLFPILHKIYVAGNHDKFIYENKKLCKQVFKDAGIIYLDKEEVVINDVKFYGDPMTPTFGNWYFTADRSKLGKHWTQIPDDVNVLLTHGPRKGVLDLTENREHELEMCGCKSLGNKIDTLKNLKLNCFGHIHNFKHIVNTGTRTINDVIYSNAASVEDARFDKGIIYFGNTITI